MGPFETLDIKAVPRGECRECDWECFRDPSEMFAPVLYGLSNPLQMIKKMMKDPDYLKYWISDLDYYRKCGLFDGRVPPDNKSLDEFNRLIPAFA